MSSPLIRAENVSIRFGGLQALSGVSFNVYPGEIVGLIGPNGAGKTTLFNSLVGLNKPNTGSIYLGGDSIMGLKSHLIAQKGMTKTFQNVALFPDMSVIENVMTAALVKHNKQHAQKKAMACLERLGQAAIADADIDDLTFPQKALIEVARAMALEPKVILLDEVMAALTPVEMDEVMAVIRSLRDQGMTFLVVEHHMRAVMSLCDRLLVLQFGKVIADGTPQEVAHNPVVISAYLGNSAHGVPA